MSLKWLDFTVLPLVVQFYSATFGFATFCCEVVCLFVVCVWCVCGAHMFGVQRLILGEISQELPTFFFDIRFCHWYLGCLWLARLPGQWASWILLFLLLRLQTHATLPCFFCGFWWSNSGPYVYTAIALLSFHPFYHITVYVLQVFPPFWVPFSFFPFSVA